MTRVLVVGARGMLGQMIARILGRVEGLSVHGTAREPSPGMHFLDAEQGVAGLRRIQDEAGPFAFLVNAAGVRQDEIRADDWRSVRRAVLVNALFPHELADLAARDGIRVIHFSTDGVFAETAGVCHEDSPVSAADAYGRTKSLGEPRADGVLTVRCSLVGPDPLRRHGLLEWLRAQPPRAQVDGYADQLWSGGTTLQLAGLCRLLIADGRFDAIRGESAIHHFTPLPAVSKLELVTALAEAFRPDLSVRSTPGPRPVTRTLATRYQSLTDAWGQAQPLRAALAELAQASE
jgi:dTDP-4-dehydrorhamnose reductase